jgi:hypothetical protein
MANSSAIARWTYASSFSFRSLSALGRHRERYKLPRLGQIAPDEVERDPARRGRNRDASLRKI